MKSAVFAKKMLNIEWFLMNYLEFSKILLLKTSSLFNNK